MDRRRALGFLLVVIIVGVLLAQTAPDRPPSAELRLADE
jgi:hypothetical protein